MDHDEHGVEKAVTDAGRWGFTGLLKPHLPASVLHFGIIFPISRDELLQHCCKRARGCNQKVQHINTVKK